MGKVKQPPTKRYPLGSMEALKLYKDDERYDVTCSEGCVWPDDPEDMRWYCVSAPGFLRIGTLDQIAKWIGVDVEKNRELLDELSGGLDRIVTMLRPIAMSRSWLALCSPLQVKCLRKILFEQSVALTSSRLCLSSTHVTAPNAPDCATLDQACLGPGRRCCALNSSAASEPARDVPHTHRWVHCVVARSVRTAEL